MTGKVGEPGKRISGEKEAFGERADGQKAKIRLSSPATQPQEILLDFKHEIIVLSFLHNMQMTPFSC